MTEILAAVLAGVGAYLLVTSRRAPGRTIRTVTARRPDWSGALGADGREVAGATVLLAVIGGALAFAIFAGPAPAVVGAIFAGSFPVASVRARRVRDLEAAAGAWPRMLEELRLLTGSVGRSVPQALIEVGRRAPAPMRDAFDAAEREWLLTTDFRRTTEVLKAALADPTADAVCETLVVANEVGGSGLERRLAELVEDRLLDVQGRKDAAAKQAGVRFARRFVLLVPVGMAAAGLSIGSGRAAYQTTGGQVAVVIGIASVAACWWWSGRLLRLPAEPRVFATSPGRAAVDAGLGEWPASTSDAERVGAGST